MTHKSGSRGSPSLPSSSRAPPAAGWVHCGGGSTAVSSPPHMTGLTRVTGRSTIGNIADLRDSQNVNLQNHGNCYTWWLFQAWKHKLWFTRLFYSKNIMNRHNTVLAWESFRACFQAFRPVLKANSVSIRQDERCTDLARTVWEVLYKLGAYNLQKLFKVLIAHFKCNRFHCNQYSCYRELMVLLQKAFLTRCEKLSRAEAVLNWHITTISMVSWQDVLGTCMQLKRSFQSTSWKWRSSGCKKILQEFLQVGDWMLQECLFYRVLIRYINVGRHLRGVITAETHKTIQAVKILIIAQNKRCF